MSIFIQLDPWVLFLVRQKCGVIRNTREDRNGPSHEPAIHFQHKPAQRNQKEIYVPPSKKSKQQR